MKQHKKIFIALVFLLFLGVLGAQALIKQSVTTVSQSAASGGNFLDAKKFHLSPEASSYLFKRYPSGLVPLPLDPKNQKYLKDYFSSEGYIIELTTAPSGPNRAAAHTGLLALKELSVQKESLKAEHKSFLKEMRSINLDSNVNREYVNVLNGVSIRNVSIDALIKIAGMDEVKEIYPIKKYHALLTDSVSQIGASSVWSMKDSLGNNITGKGVKIAIVDTGIDYTHPDLGGCSAEQIEGDSIAIAGLDYSFESVHPYSDRINQTWNITMPGFSRIAIHFKNISLEEDFDIIYVKNASGDVIGKYTGYLNNVWSDSVKGDTIYLNFVSDGSISDWGFSIDKVFNGSTDYSMAGCAKVAYGYDYVNNDNNPIDDMGHGTHCASIAAGNGALKGVAPNATLMAYKVLDSGGSGYDDDIIAGIEKAVLDGADVISISLGGTGDPDDAMSKAVDAAVDSGVVVAVAAGNDGPYNGTIGSPGCARKAITVGAVYKEGDLRRNELTSLTINGLGREVNSGFVQYSKVTSDSGVSGQLMNAGLGLESDYSGMDCSGKIALIRRANPARIRISNQVKNAYKAGCVGAVIYNNIDDNSLYDDYGYTIWTLDNLSLIPVVWINKTDGEYLGSLASNTTVTAKLNVIFDPVLVADFSSRGPVYMFNKPDVLAPGVDICAARCGDAFEGDGDLCFDDKHIMLSGTSMATPHVAGAAALLKQKNPGWSALEIKAALKNTARSLGANSEIQGAGVINVSAAAQLATAPPVVFIYNVSDVTYRGLK